MAIFEKTATSYSELDNQTLFKEISGRIKSQSYDYSRTNNKNLYTSLFFDVENPSDIFVPLFNYFDDTVSWYRTNIYNPIKLTQKYKFYGAYKDILDSDAICELFENGKIKNLVLESDKDYKYNKAFNIQIINEVLYKKRIYFLINLVIDNQNEYTIIPIEGALSVRGDNVFRTDQHGNNLDSKVMEDGKRYKIISFQ